MIDTGRVHVVLLSPRNPLNIGAAARAMSNFGFSSLRLVDAYEVAYREAKSAVNASAVLTRSVQYGSVAEAVADCALVIGTASVGHRELQLPMIRLEAGAQQIREAARPGSVALLFGSEKFGMTNDEIDHCHWLMRIPTREEHESMNLGQAVAICLYELIREDAMTPPRPRIRHLAGAGLNELLTKDLFEVLLESGYVNKLTAESTEAKLRRMIRRVRLSDRDATVWLGIVRQIRWRIRQSGELSPPG